MEPVDVKASNVKKFLEAAHHGIIKRTRNLSDKTDSNYVFESRLFQLLCREKYLSARRCAEKFSERYGVDVGEEEVIRAFRSCRINNVDKRREVFDWAESAVENFIRAVVSGSQQVGENYFKTAASADFNFSDVKHKIFCLMLYVKHPELDTGGDLENLEKFGSVFAKFLRLDMHSFLRELCKIPKRERGSRVENEDALLIRDLQDDFEERLKQSHQNEIAEFFSRLNSEEYGYILDTLIDVRSGISRLRRQNVELPEEISGLFILIDNFTKFVRANEINPVMKLGSIHNMKASDIESRSGDYEGTPYGSAEEIKRVKVISPGWHYKDIQISRPRFQEYGDEILDK